MGDGRWEMGDGRWEMGDGRWKNKDFEQKEKNWARNSFFSIVFGYVILFLVLNF